MRISDCIKKLASAAAFAVFIVPAAHSQTLYKSGSAERADVKVCPVENVNRADLVVYVTQYAHRAIGNKGIWFLTDREDDECKSIYFTNNEWSADIKVFFTIHENEAGWRNKSKKHLLDCQ